MRSATVVVLALAVVAGCKDNTGGAAAPGEAQPAAAMGAPEGGLQGKVEEKIDAATYTYLRLTTADGEMWAAVPQAEIAVGTTVTIVGANRMDGFESKTLNRKFDKIVFGQLAGSGAPKGGMLGMMGGGAAPATAPAAPAAAEGPAKMQPGMHPPVANGPAGTEDVKVEKAPGANAKTVAEINGQKAQLKDAKVVVRAKVVKVNNGILGKNWLHLRDGSGSADAKDNDITVTTAEVVNLGDVVTLEGAVHLDRDFGAGYTYGVIMEDATLKK